MRVTLIDSDFNNDMSIVERLMYEENLKALIISQSSLQSHRNSLLIKDVVSISEHTIIEFDQKTGKIHSYVKIKDSSLMNLNDYLWYRTRTETFSTKFPHLLSQLTTLIFVEQMLGILYSLHS